MKNQPPPAAAEVRENWFAENVKKQIPVMIFTIVMAFVASYWTARDAQNDVRYQLVSLKEKNEQLAAANARNADAISQLTIALTKVSEAQIRFAEDVKKVQEQQQRNTEMLFNRK